MALIGMISEALSLLSLELMLFCFAALVYAVVTGKIPGLAKPSKSKKICDPEEAEEESAAQELQARLAAGDHRAAFRVWQRVKSLDGAPSAPVNLAGVVRAMRALRKSEEEIVSELRSGFECNEALGQSAGALLEALRREGDTSLNLVAAVVPMLEGQGVAVADAAYESLLAGHLRRRNFGEVAAVASRRKGALTPRMRMTLAAAAAHQSKLDEALQHLEQLPLPGAGSGESGAWPQQVVSRVLLLALRENRLAEVLSKLQAHQVHIETRVFDEVLKEVVQREDASSCQGLLELSSVLKVKRGPQTYELLCKGLAGDAAAVCALYEEMVAAEVEVSEHICAGVMRAFVARGLEDRVCDLYEQRMASPVEFRVGGQLRSLVLEAAGKAGRASIVEALSAESEADVEKHAMAIKACGLDRNVQGAKRVFDNLKKSGAPMNPLVYNCLIDSCMQCGDAESALEYFAQMKQLDFVDVVSYNTVIKAHLSRRRFDEAKALLREMGSRGLSANQVTYNEFLRALIAARDRRAVWSLVDDMQASKVAPDATMCSLLLKSLTEHSHSSDIGRTVALLHQMQDPIDEVLFSSASEACIRAGRLDELSALIQQLEQQGVSLALTAPCYGSMIKAFGNGGDVDRVWHLWGQMEKRGVRPTSITVGCTVDALVKNGHTDDAWALVQELSLDEEKRQYVNTVIFSTVLKGFGAARQPKRIFAVQAVMRDAGVPCNTITYNTIIDACARCSCMDRVPALLEEMKQGQVEPDVITYSTLVKGYCIAGDVDRAFMVLAGMKADGKYAPDEILYNSLLDGCAKQNRVDDALKLLKDMRASGIMPSNFTLSIMVKLLGRAKRLEEAFALVDELCKESGLHPNIHVYTCLVQACAQNRKINRALALHDTMITEAGCMPDEKFYSALARGCLQVGSAEKAALVVRCAHHLPGHTMATSRGPARGTEPRVAEETLAKLQASGAKDREVAAELASDLQASGVSGVSARRPPQGARGPARSR